MRTLDIRLCTALSLGLPQVDLVADKLTAFGGLDGVLKDMVRIQVPSA